MVYKDSAGKEIHEGDSLMDLTPGFVGEISEVFLDEDDDEEKCAVIDTTIGVEPANLYRYHGTREECLVYIQEHSNEPNLGIIP